MRTRTPIIRSTAFRIAAGTLAGGLILTLPASAFGAGGRLGRLGGGRFDESSVATSTTSTVGTSTGGSSTVGSSTPGSTTPTTTAGGASNGGTSPSGSNAPASAPNCRSNFSQWQQKVEQELSGRVNQLATLTDRVNAAQYLTSGDKTTLQGLLSSETAGIQALVTKVPNDTTCAELRADAHNMVFNYRVYLVMTPQTDLTIGADTETAIATNVEGLEPALQSAIAGMPSGSQQANAQAAYTDLVQQINGALSAVNGLSVTLLAQTPAGCPGNASVFTGAKASETTAQADLKAGRHDIAQIIADLSSAKGAAGAAPDVTVAPTTTTGA